MNEATDEGTGTYNIDDRIVECVWPRLQQESTKGQEGGRCCCCKRFLTGIFWAGGWRTSQLCWRKQHNAIWVKRSCLWHNHVIKGEIRGLGCVLIDGCSVVGAHAAGYKKVLEIFALEGKKHGGIRAHCHGGRTRRYGHES